LLEFGIETRGKAPKIATEKPENAKGKHDANGNTTKAKLNGQRRNPMANKF